MKSYLLKLYIAGKTARASSAIADLHRICDKELPDQFKLEIIDVLEDPDRAEEDKIFATPTLIRSLPPPPRRVIGDLSDTEKVLFGLDIVPLGSTPPVTLPDARP